MTKQKIFFEGLGLVDGHFSGIGHYIAGILRGADYLAGQARLQRRPFPEIEVIIPYTSVSRFRSFGFQHIKYRAFPLPFRVMSGLHHRNKLPPLDLICGKGLYIFTRFATMPLAFSKSMVMVYDISFELYKEFAEDRNARFLSATVTSATKQAQKVITISQNARDEIISFYNLAPENVIVATPAVDRTLFYKHDKDRIKKAKQRYDITGEYILYVGNLEPRKNLNGLVDAYTSLPKQLTEKYSLLLVGVSGWKTDDLFKKIIDQYKKGYKIIRPSSYVLDEDLPALYSGAEVLAYPTHYEGFGMPPLEALACGTPVITANNSSLPEVVGSEALLIDDKSTPAVAEALKRYLGDGAVQQKALRDGPAQAAKFSWIQSAQHIIDNALEILG